MITYEWTALVTLLAVILIIVLMFRVGLGRGKYKVDAPKMSGEKTWDKMFRIHANSVEQGVIFFPALWLAALTAGDMTAAIGGAVWLVGRVIYAFSYLKDPKSRAPGMLFTIGSTATLAGIALYHVVSSLIS